MTDSNIKPEPFDIDHDQGGRLTTRYGGRLWASVDQGRTWRAVETDCDGLAADWSWLGKVAGELGSVAQRVADVARIGSATFDRDTARRAASEAMRKVHIDGPDFRTVEIQDGKGQRIGKIWASTTMPRTPIARPSFVVVDDLEVPAIRLDGIDLSASGTQAGRGQRVRAVPRTDTPGPNGTGAKSGTMIEVPAEGWPSGWHDSPLNTRRKFATDGGFAQVPNTEPGRRAAWAMEGE